MANYNKSFNLRNGVQVDEDDLIVRSSLVGIGTTIPRSELDVYGNIRASGLVTTTNLFVSGIATFNDVQIGTGITIDGNSGVIAAKFYGDGAGLYNIPTSQWVDVDPAIYPGVGLGYSSIWAGGTVGIGTTIPRSWLQIGGDPNYAQDGVGISSTGNINASGIITGGFLVGSGAGITNINATNIASGTLSNSRLPSNISVSGVITAASFSGQISADVSIISSLSGTNLNYSGVGTIATLNSTTGTITNLSSSTATVTNLTSTNLSGTIGTITTLNSTSGTIANLSGTIGTITTLNSTNANLTNINSSGISTLSTLVVSGVTTSASLTVSGTTSTQNLSVSGVATVGVLTATTTFIGVSTATTLRAGNLRLGVTAVNQLDTSSGNLILDSSSGLTQINDNLSVSGISTLSGEVQVDTGIVPDASLGAYLGQSGKEFSELWVDEVKIGVGAGNSNKIETKSTDLILDSATNKVIVDANLNVTGVTTLTGVLTLGGGIEPSTDNTVTLGTASKRFSSSQISAVRIGVAQSSEIDTTSGTDLVLNSSSGTTRINDNLIVSGIGSFGGEITTVLGIVPDDSKGAYIGTAGKPFNEAYVNEVRIGAGASNMIDTKQGSLRLDGANNLVSVDNNLTVSGISTLFGNLVVGAISNDFVVNTISKRVGIGTNVLTRKFQVKDVPDLVVEFRTDATDVTIGLGRKAVGSGSSVGKIFYSTNALIFDNEDFGGLEFITNSGTAGVNTAGFKWRWGQNTGNPLLDLTYDGKLGLGKTDPEHTLHVVGTSTVTEDAFFNRSSFSGIATFFDNVYFGGPVIFNNPDISLPDSIETNISALSGISTFHNVQINNGLIIDPFSTASLKVGIGTTLARFGLDAEKTFAIFKGIGIGVANPVGVLTTGNGLTIGGIDETGSYGKLVALEGSKVGIGTSLCDDQHQVALYGSALISPSTADGVPAQINFVNIRKSQLSLDTYSGLFVGPYPLGLGATVLSRPRALIDFGGALGIGLTTHRYMIPPIITTSDRNAIGLGTVQGALIYNSTNGRFEGYSSSGWNELGAGAGAGSTSIINSNQITVSGIVTAASFVGDGSGLTGVVGSGSGVVIKDDGSLVGTAGTINFGDNISVSPISAGVVTVTVGFSQTASYSAVAGVSTNVSGGTASVTQINVSGISTLGTVKISSGIVTALSGTVTYYGDVSNAADGRWILGANGSSDYTFTGIGFTVSVNDPTLYLTRGKVYEFVNTMGMHPFRIQSTANGSVGTQFNRGVTNNDVSNGTLRFEVPMDAPSTLYYQCTAHPNMGGVISIIDGVNLSPSQLNVSGVSTFTNTINLNAGNLKVATDGIIKVGNSDQLEIYYNEGTGQTIKSTGDLRILTSRLLLNNAANDEQLIEANQNGSVALYYDNSKKFETLGAGVTVTGTTFTNQLSVSGVSTFNNTTTVKGDFTVSQTPSGDPTFKLETTPGNQTNGGGFTLIPSGFTFGLDPNNWGHTFRWNVDTGNTGYGYALKGYGGFKLKLQNQQTYGGNPITDLVTIVDDGSTTIAGDIRVAGISTLAANGGITTTGGSLFTKQLSVSGVVTASSFVGDGSGLTNVGGGNTANVRTNTLVVSGVSTFTNTANFNNSIVLENGSIYGASKIILSGGLGGDTLFYNGGTSYSDFIFNTLQGGISIENARISKDGVLNLPRVSGGLNVSGVSTFSYIQNTGITSTKDLIVYGNGNDAGSISTVALMSRNNYIDFGPAIPNTSAPQQFALRFGSDRATSTFGLYNILGASYSFPTGSVYLNNWDGTSAISINDNGVSILKPLNVGAGVTVTGTTFTNQLSVSGVSTFVGNTFVGNGITMYASTGIVSATSFYGSFNGSITDATNLTGGYANASRLNVSGIATISAGRIQADAGSNLRFGNLPAGSGSSGRNIAIGDQVLVTLSGGSGRNIGIGELSYYDTTSGQYNIGLGIQAGQKITTGSYNVIIGGYNGQTGLDLRTSSNNVVIADGQGNIRQYIDSNGNVGIKTTVVTEALTVSGIVSATSFYGTLNAGQLTGVLPAIDGSNLFGVTATGSGIEIRDNGVTVGTAATIDFGTNLDVTFGSGIATVSGASSVSAATTAYALAGTPNLNVGIVTATRLVSSGATLTSPFIVGLTTFTDIASFRQFGGDGSYSSLIRYDQIVAFKVGEGYWQDRYLSLSSNLNYILPNVGIGTTNATSKLTVGGNINATGVVTASSFSGSGSGLTNLPAGQLTGTLPAIDGSALLNVNATGSGIVVLDDNTNVGSAKTVNFGTGLEVTYSAAGIATVTASGGSLKSRTVVTGVTTSIANNGIGNTNITGFKSYSLMKVGLSTAGWLRLYTDSASRAADASRSIGIDPTPGSGVIAEVVTTGISTTQIISPFVMGGNLDEPASTTIYAAITNLSGTTQAITANLTILQLEE